jgi:KUP system potassium uptake protein
LLLGNPAAVENPFYLMAPEWARLPLVLIATAATIIASQAVISGAFSVTHQAIQLGFIPRLKTLHTSERAVGQIYIPSVNWGLLIMVLVLIASFGESTRLASAYGISVVGTMIITSAMLAFLVFHVWRWNRVVAGATIALFAIVDGTFFASNITKVADGGWFPLVVAGVIFVLLTTWAKGRQLMRDKLAADTVPLDVFIGSAGPSVHRIGGTAVFLTAASEGVPAALLHNLKHNQVLHERILILTVKVEEVPSIAPEERLKVTRLSHGFFRVTLHYGFMDDVDVPRDLAAIEQPCGASLDLMRTSFFLGRQKLIASREVAGMALWREHLFAWMLKTSESAMDFFRLPTNRVVEGGSQLRI